MNILHIVQGYSPAIGGTEWLVQRVAEELVRQFNDRVTVFTTDRFNAEGFVKPLSTRMNAGWEEVNGVRVRRFKIFNLAAPLLKPVQALAYRFDLPYNQYLRTAYAGPIIPGLGRHIRRYPADIVVAASFPLLHMYIALDAARASSRPCVFVGCLHPEDRWGFQRPMIVNAIKKADHYLALTSYEAKYIIERGVAADRVSVVGAGVDPAPYSTTDNQAAKLRFGLENQVVVGYVGQLVEHKGIDMLLRAMPLVWNVAPNVRLLVAGSKTRYERRLQAIVSQWPLEYHHKAVFHYNFSDQDKPYLYSALDIFAYPSKFESFGIVFLEAWAAGRPVIGCERGAISSVVSSGQDGLLIKRQDEYGLADAILSLIQNPELARQMGQSGKKKVLAQFTWPQVAQRFRDGYQLALAER